jgi:hypothetical protein
MIIFTLAASRVAEVCDAEIKKCSRRQRSLSF